MASKNVTMPFSQIQGRLTCISLWRQLFLATCRCIYKMLVVCVSDNKGRSLLLMTNVMFFIVTSNTLDSKQNITSMIKKDFFFSMNLYHSCPCTLSLKMQILPKLECTLQDFKLNRPWKLISRVNVTFSRILCFLITSCGAPKPIPKQTLTCFEPQFVCDSNTTIVI